MQIRISEKRTRYCCAAFREYALIGKTTSSLSTSIAALDEFKRTTDSVNKDAILALREFEKRTFENLERAFRASDLTGELDSAFLDLELRSKSIEENQHHSDINRVAKKIELLIFGGPCKMRQQLDQFAIDLNSNLSAVVEQKKSVIKLHSVKANASAREKACRAMAHIVCNEKVRLLRRLASSILLSLKSARPF